MPVDIEVDPLRLKAALRDFVALSAIPAVSVGRKPEAVAAGLADSLVEVLQLDFAFVRMSDPGGVAAIEVTRGSARTNFRESLESHVSPISSGATREVVLDVGDGSRPCPGIAIPIGVNGKGGLVVAASTRSDFPSAIDRVLLSLAANHAAIAFENARLFHERDQAEEGLRKARDELEARVAERTAELNVANEELSALRRVATLVAEAAAPSTILDAVAGEMQELLDADQVALNRFEPDAEIVVLAHRGLDVDRTPVGSRVSHEGENVTSIVRRTGSPARMENYEQAGGALAELARATGLRSSVSAPITVEGQVWGVVTASWKGDETPPADTEDRMAKFAHLIDTAIANAEARAEVEQLADEQAALRRVATLVARGITPEEVFQAVAAEVGVLFGSDTGAIVRFEDDRTVTVLGAVTGPHEVGKRVTLDPGSAVDVVRETSRSARFDTDDPWAPDMPSLVRALGIRSAVASPIVVEGELWGAITTASLDGPLPLGAERRLTEFTELVATAVANTQAREEVTMLVDEQAALRRVAVLVAQQPSPSEVFAAVTQAVGLLLDADLAVLHVFPGDGTATTVASWSADGPMLPIGTRFPLHGDGLAARIFESGAPARLHSYDEAWERAETDLARSLHLRSAVGAPILVEGKLWGALMAATRRVEPWTENAETRIAAFTELVATAIANAEARAEVERLADEQAALRRVATLVAHGTEPATVFGAVCNEAQALLGADEAGILRYHDDRTVTVMANSGESGQHRVGARVSFDRGFVVDWVHETHQAARFDTDDPAAADMPEVVRMLGVRSAVGSPIVVDGELWGVITLASVDRSLPLGMERRLTDFTELVATAIAKAESKSALDASRRRIVAASDETRRRIERDLHDGTQQRLVSLGLAVRAAEAKVPPEQAELHDALSRIAVGLTGAVDDLQELTRGIHPAILSRGGLGPALRMLARRSPIPVKLEIATDAPLPQPAEVAAYFVASEILANAAKHAQASRIEMSLVLDEEGVVLTIRDDGVGGADPGQGSGLIGLADRVEALGGSIDIESRLGDGTRITARIPSELEAETSSEQDR